MIAILGSLLGFFSSSIPSIFKYFQDKADKAHELQMMQLQMQYAGMQIQQQLQAVELQAQVAQDAGLYKTYNTGINWVDALNGTVRPVLSYAFFLLYALIKYMQFDALEDSMANLAAHTDVLWTQNDSVVFSSIVSFYFGSRYFART